jgi:hypothetical protein
MGASGFSHQIDASVHSPSKLLLVECKYWTDPVDVEPVLVLASRMADIQSNYPGTSVHGSIVSKQEPTSGAKTLASYFGISIDTVQSPRDYALRIFHQVFIGFHDVLPARDFMTFEVIKAEK